MFTYQIKAQDSPLFTKITIDGQSVGFYGDAEKFRKKYSTAITEAGYTFLVEGFAQQEPDKCFIKYSSHVNPTSWVKLLPLIDETDWSSFGKALCLRAFKDYCNNPSFEKTISLCSQAQTFLGWPNLFPKYNASEVTQDGMRANYFLLPMQDIYNAVSKYKDSQKPISKDELVEQLRKIFSKLNDMVKNNQMELLIDCVNEEVLTELQNTAPFLLDAKKSYEILAKDLSTLLNCKLEFKGERDTGCCCGCFGILFSLFRSSTHNPETDQLLSKKNNILK